jgi:hypothetical protein
MSAGQIETLKTQASTTSTATSAIEGRGAHRKATFIVEILTITGTWNISIDGLTNDGTTVDIAATGNQTTTGIKTLALQTGDVDWTIANAAIPEPQQVVFTEVATGACSGTVYAIYGD